jgi:hypothetical protein
MGWRKITKADIRRGVAINLDRDGSPFWAATIVGIEGDTVNVSRPYVYAHEGFNSKSGLIGVENFSMTLDRMCDNTSTIQVYQSSHADQAETYLT